MARDNDRNTSRRGKESLSIKLTVGPFRMSFPHVITPEDTDNGERYTLHGLFPPDWRDKPDYKALKNALYDVYEEMFGTDERKWPQGRNDRGPDQVIRDAEEKNYAGYKPGWFFMKMSSKDQPGIVDANREEVTNEREIYGGRWARASITIAAYDNKSKGVGVYLNSLQVLSHDEPFGGRGPAKNDFDDYDGPSLSDDDRGTGTGHSRPRDDRDDRRGGGRDRDDSRNDRGTSRRDRDDEDTGRRGGSRGRDDNREDRDTGRGRDRDREDDRGSRGRGRDDREDDRPSRGRDRDDDRSRGRDRDTDDRSRGRDARDRDDGDRGRGSRDRDDRDDRPSRGRGRDRDDRDDRDDDRNWN